MKRAVPVSAVIATVVIALSFLREGKPEVSAWMSFNSDTRQWQVKGHVRFARGGTVHLLGWSSYLAVRTAPFDLTIANESLSSDMYEPAAIQNARAGSGEWELDYLAILAGWLVLSLTCLVISWLFGPRSDEPRRNGPLKDWRGAVGQFAPGELSHEVDAAGRDIREEDRRRRGS